MSAALLARLGVDALERPHWLWLLLPLVAVAILRAARAPVPALAWPGLEEARRAGARRRDRVRGLALALRTAALVLLALVLAGPVGLRRLPPEPGLGLDLLLAVDASGSMRALDAELGGVWRTRLELARQVVARFAERRTAEGDRVGLVVFGESAFTQCPLTSDAALLGAALTRLRPGVAGEATALGDALALAVKRVRGAAGADDVAGRVIVLLSDGRSNAGAVSVEMATALAVGEGVRVHAVAIGSAGARVLVESEAAAGQGLRFERHDVDASVLARIAEATGGRFFEARRSSELEGVYAAIDALERVPRRGPARIARSDRPEPLLALAGACLLAEISLARVARRRLP